jgi:hypothetical protein
MSLPVEAEAKPLHERVVGTRKKMKLRDEGRSAMLMADVYYTQGQAPADNDIRPAGAAARC